MEADSRSTNLHTGGSIAGGDRSIFTGWKGHEDELKFAKYKANTANGLLAAIFGKLTSEARPEIWVRQPREYLGELGLDFSDVGKMDTEDIGREVNKWENNRCRRDIESKTTPELYRSKGNLGDEGIYSNEYGSVLLFQCRTNALKLRQSQGFEGRAVDCSLCGE